MPDGANSIKHYNESIHHDEVLKYIMNIKEDIIKNYFKKIIDNNDLDKKKHF